MHGWSEPCGRMGALESSACTLPWAGKASPIPEESRDLTGAAGSLAAEWLLPRLHIKRALRWRPVNTRACGCACTHHGNQKHGSSISVTLAAFWLA